MGNHCETASTICPESLPPAFGLGLGERLPLPRPQALGLAGAVGLGTAGNGDLGALFDDGVVLPGESGGHDELGAAEIALGGPGEVRGEYGVGALGEF